MEISSLLNPVINREVEMSVETGPEPEPSTTYTASRKEEAFLSSLQSDEISEEDSTFIIKIGEKQFECPFCEGVYTSIPYVHEHIDDVHLGLKPFSCPKCGFAFATNSRLKRHIKARFGCRFECTVCQKRFMVQENLDNRVCTRQVSTSTFRSQPEQLATEVSTSRPTSGGESTCPKCFKTFVNGYIMKRHDDAVHLGLRLWSCLICGFAFSYKRSLKRHTARNTCKPRPATSVEQNGRYRIESLARQASLTLGKISRSTAVAEHCSEEHEDEEHADEEHADEEHADEEHADEGMLLDWE
jgi:uncharacterized Zn-finger protein